MRGCAAGIPGTPDPATVASGPTGPATWGWDNDGSYGDWYGGHELGHTYGRLHIGSGCGETADDPSYPYPTGQISNNDGAFVGFDLGDPANAIAMRALPGTAWRDVMSYCANQWLSDYTYRAILQRLRAENGLPAGPDPVPVAGATPSVTGPALGAATLRPAATIATSDALAPVREAKEATPGNMLAPAYAPPGLVKPVGPGPSIPAAAYETMPDVKMGRVQPVPVAEMGAQMADGPQVPAGPTAATRLVEVDSISVVGLANLTKNTGRIDYVRRVARALVPQTSGPTDLQLRVLDRAGRELGTYPAQFRPNSERDLGEDLIGVVEGIVAPRPEMAAIELLVRGVVASRYVSPETTRLDPTDLRVVPQREQPSAVPSPAGETASQLLKLEWGSGAGADPARLGQGAKVTYDVQASRDGGRTWQTLAVNVPTPTTEIDVAEFKDDPRIDVRVVANSGFESKVIAQRSIVK